MDDVRLRKPTERTCERCGRREVWHESADAWLVETDDGEKAVGNPHCIHEWDINGRFVPFERE